MHGSQTKFTDDGDLYLDTYRRVLARFDAIAASTIWNEAPSPSKRPVIGPNTNMNLIVAYDVVIVVCDIYYLQYSI